MQTASVELEMTGEVEVGMVEMEVVEGETVLVPLQLLYLILAEGSF